MRKTSKKGVVIWGTLFSAEFLFNKIKEKENVICFIDNDASKWGKNTFDDLQIESPEKLKQLMKNDTITKIYLGISVLHYEDVYKQIKELNSKFDEIYGITKHGEIYKYAFEEGEKPVLNYIEFDVIRKCNLNCRACNHFSNIVDHVGTYTVQNMERDFMRLSELFDNIEIIRMVGGEPFLNKDIGKMIRKVKEIFPKSNIEIVSNGLLITKLSDEVVKAIADENVQVCVTQYDAVKRMLPMIRAFCEKNKISYCEFGYNRDEFKKVLNLSGDSDKEKIFKQCQFRKCTTLYNGVIGHCSLERYIYAFNKKYGTTLPENNGVNIYDPQITGWDIKNFLQTSSDMCCYCTEPISIDWSNGIENADINDWVVKF